MATLVEPGNKMPLGSGGGPTTSQGAVESHISKTKELAFPSGEQISLENFEHKGDKPAGWINSLSEMQNLSGKELQESYRAGLPESAKYVEKVSDR